MIRNTDGQDIEVSRPSRRNKWLSLTILLSLLVAVLGVYALPNITALYQSDAQIPRTQVRLATVSKGSIRQDISVQGQVVAAIKPTLYAPYNGTVALNVVAGDHVAKGELLAEVNSPNLKNQLSQQQAEWQKRQLDHQRQQIEAKATLLQLSQAADLAEVDLLAAQREMNRADISMKQALISRVDFEAIEVALKKAELGKAHRDQDLALETERLAFEQRSQQQEVEQQRLVVEELQRQVEALRILAPFDGVVGNVSVSEQDVVNENSPLLTLVNMSAFEVNVLIPQNYADELVPGMSADVLIENKAFSAELIGLAPQVVNGQVSGRLKLQQAPEGLRQNQRLTAKIYINDLTNVVKVTRGPFVETSGGSIAYVVNDNLAIRHPIQLGAYSSKEVEVISGLNEGDTIIISSLERFSQNQQIYLTQ